MRIIFLIIKVGVYRHDIFGAFTDLDEAKEHAKKLADTDQDDYHEYAIQPIKLNHLCDININDTSWFKHQALELDQIVSFRKKI